MISVFNEKKYAENMIEQGFLSTDIRFELKIIAKYCKCEYDIPNNQMKELLKSFCETWLHGFRYEVHYSIINSTIAYLTTDKCKHINIEGVFISEEFVQYFIHLPLENDMKKLLFTLGVWGKLNLELEYSEKFAYSYNKYRDLKNSANINTKGSVLELVHELSNLGYVTGYYTGAIQLDFLKNIPDGMDMHKITDFNNIGSWFDFYNGVKRLYICEKCKKIYKKANVKANNQKFCKECSVTRKIGSKLINCEVCSQPLFVSAKSNHKTMCNECYSDYRKEYFAHRTKH